ncbi:MAG: lysophospholipid acyltransferase family protein [Deltaproteobacteria bacterium]
MLAILVFGGLAVLLLLRLPESLIFGVRRPWTSHLVPFVSRNALRIIGLPLVVEGTPMTAHGGLVANHSSWLDIFVLSAVDRFYFVSKSEVAGWPVIGWLARATGTVFIRRDRKDTTRQQELFNQRLAQGHRLLFFPEGTSTDGKRVLPFKSTLFEPFFAKGHAAGLMIQPITVVYAPPQGAPLRFYGWWGDMDFASHLVKVLAAPRQGTVHVIFHPEIAVDSVAGRKDLAVRCEAVVRAAHPYANS